MPPSAFSSLSEAPHAFTSAAAQFVFLCERLKAAVASSECLRVVIYSDFTSAETPFLVPACEKKKKEAPPPRFPALKKLLACPSQQLSLSIAAIQFTPAQTLDALMKLGQTQPDENLQIGACAHIKIGAKHTSEAACVILIEL